MSDDNSVIIDAPAAEQPVESAPTPQPETGELTPKVDDPSPEQNSEEHDDPQLPKGVKKRFDTLTRQKYELQAQMQELQQRLAQQEQARQPTLQKPDIAQFDDLATYEQAIEDYTRQTIGQQVQQQQYAAQSQAELASNFQANIAKERALIPDFDATLQEIMQHPIASNDFIANTIAADEDGAKIAYYLGKNQNEAYRLLLLSPQKQLIELGKIAAKVNATPQKKVTSAPSPAPSVKASPTITSDPTQMTTAQYMKWRNDQQLSKQRR